MIAVIEKTLIDNYGISIPEAKKISEAIDVVDTFKKNLQIKDESKYLSTKEDIANVRIEIANTKMELKSDIASVRTELKSDIASVRTEIANVRTQIYIVAIATTGCLGGLMTLFKFLH